MPELPEVEIICTGLQTLVTGREITSLEIHYPGCVSTKISDFEEQMLGRTIAGVRRRAKLAIIDLDSDLHLVFHLKMTGKLLFDDDKSLEVDKHTHLVIHFADRTRLLFRDVRKFGYCACLATGDLQEWPFYAKLGPEPLSMEFQEFKSLFRNRKGRIKCLLLNQEVIAGIGNIYADESLHLAGIHPAQACSDIPEQQLRQLFKALQQVLTQAIQSGGSSFSDYVNSLGTRGSFQDRFQVYGRRGHPCRACTRKLEHEKVAGRTSVFCPTCQPLRCC